jgi:hypothetical protein
MSKAVDEERVISEKSEPVDEGASTERGLAAGESFREDCLEVEEIVPLEFIVQLTES